MSAQKSRTYLFLLFGAVVCGVSLVCYTIFISDDFVVIDTVTMQPIANANLTVEFKIYIPTPGHQSSFMVTAKTTTTNEKGQFDVPLWARIFSYSVRAKKEGYTLPDPRYWYKLPTVYLTPTTEAVMKEMEYLWNLNTQGPRFSDVKYYYVGIVKNYEKAKSIAKTDREIAFSRKFCELALKTYAGMTKEEKAELPTFLQSFSQKPLQSCPGR